MNDMARIIKRAGLKNGIAAKVAAILQGWIVRGIGFWPKTDSNPKDWIRAASIFGQAYERQETVRFFVPVCPDYPSERQGKLGVGILESNVSLITIGRNIAESLEDAGIRFEMDYLLADTETDIEEIVMRLAGSSEEFLIRCNLSVSAIQKEISKSARVSSFSDFFQGNWHRLQYFFEDKVKDMSDQNNLGAFIKDVAGRRTEKFENQFGRRLSYFECIQMAIRHYAQYSAMGYWVRQFPGSILINTDSPNLRAIRKPLDLGNVDFLSIASKPQQRIPIISPVSS